MAMHNQLPKRFAKHVVRKALATTSRATSFPLQPRGIPSHIQARDFVAEKQKIQTSGLTLFQVAVILGGLAALFLLAVFIGLILKFANRPKTEARHPQYTPKGMYQPSAAGYGTATPRPEDSFHDMSSAKTGLLDSAGPMGHGGNYEDADSSTSSGGHHPSADDARRPLARGHTRGASTGIDISAPSAAFRRNASGQHPPLGANGAFDGPQYSSRGGSNRAPDGSGFTPGQPINQSAVFGSPPRNAPQGIIHARQTSLNPSGQPRQGNRGPPPSTTRTRPGRYANASQDSTATNGTHRSRIDSIGPGTYRKSMYLNENNSSSEQNTAQNVRRTPSGRDGAPVNLRRVDSVGKGDPRRTSRYQPGSRAGILPSMMNMDANNAMPTRSPPRNAYTQNAAGHQIKGGAGWAGNQSASAPGYMSQNGRSARGPLGPLTPNGAEIPASYAPGYPVQNRAPMNGPSAARMPYGGPQQQYAMQRQQQQGGYPQSAPRPGYPVMASGGYDAQNFGPNGGRSAGMFPPSSRPMQAVPGVGGAGRPLM